MKINEKLQVRKQSENIVLDFNNNGSKGTIFSIKDKEAEALTNNISVRLTKETAKKLGEALLKLSKGS